MRTFAQLCMSAVIMAAIQCLLLLVCVAIVTCDIRSKRQLTFSGDTSENIFNPFLNFGQRPQQQQVGPNFGNPFGFGFPNQNQGNNQGISFGQQNAQQPADNGFGLLGALFGNPQRPSKPNRHSAFLQQVPFLGQFFNGSGYEVPLDVTGNQQQQETRFLNLGFNKPNEVFQPCLTPSQSPGNCRHVLHCIIPELFNPFVGISYLCPIKGGFLGVCCPHYVQPINTQPPKPTTVPPKPAVPVYSGEGCGEHVNFNTRIVGGREADPKEWPWMTALLRNSADQYCGGALISPQHILTAAHCMVGFQPSGVRVRLGEYNFDESSADSITLNVVNIIMHPNYNKGTYENDIAVLKMEREIPFTDAIKPVCLAPEGRDFTNQLAVVTGWGTISYGGPTSPKLLEVSIPVWNQEECQKGYPQNILPTQICAGLKAGGKDSCQGDSGGPLVARPPDSNNWLLIGVVSWGIRCAEPGRPGVYTRVSKYLDWIDSAMAQ